MMFAGTSRFEVLRLLGSGGMGSVYLARDRHLQAQVALKTLNRADGVDLFRFKREFRSLADLRHANLVTLYELFSEGELWYFTMEHVPGSAPRSLSAPGPRRVALRGAAEEHAPAALRGGVRHPRSRLRPSRSQAAERSGDGVGTCGDSGLRVG